MTDIPDIDPATFRKLVDDLKEMLADCSNFGAVSTIDEHHSQTIPPHELDLMIARTLAQYLAGAMEPELARMVSFKRTSEPSPYRPMATDHEVRCVVMSPQTYSAFCSFIDMLDRGLPCSE